MRVNITTVSLLSTIVFLAAKCPSGNDSEKAAIKTNMKIVLADSLALNYEDEDRHLPEIVQELCAVLISENKDCANTIILEPALYRPDLNKEFSLKTNIEKGGSKDVSNPKVIGRLINKNLEELSIPKDFEKPYTGKNAGADISSHVQSKAAKDSILIFIPNGSADTYTLNGKSYKAMSDVEDVRNRMLAVLCQNPKANFTLLVDPPAQTAEPTVKPPKTNQAPPQPEAKDTKPSPTAKSVSVRRGFGNTRPVGDLTIIKDSEGCDICTRYYKAYDATGRTHEIREQNSTNCCPCNKTVEIRGRTYVMNCDGSPRLQAVN
ncbi:hypothetical protein GCM10027578_30600 [Spirosoma luteolum]